MKNIIPAFLGIRLNDDKTSKNSNRQNLFNYLNDYSRRQGVKIMAVGLSGFSDFEAVATKLWQQLDIVPIEYKGKGAADGTAKAECHLAQKRFDKDFVPQSAIGRNRAVEPQFLTDLKAYQKISSKEDWKNILAVAKECRERHLKVIFINSTAAGGGVALMRHALIRFYKLLGVDVRWLVMAPDLKVFDITKKKIHNVLQGVAPAGVILTSADQKIYNAWIKKNFALLRPEIARADVIICDDPQPSGLLPLIKAAYPKIKIIYRSHIQVYAPAIDRGDRQNRTTWDFVWKNASLADIFVSHPIAAFVPREVPRDKVVYLPATTDPLDGLNKKIVGAQKNYYLDLFNSIVEADGGEPLDKKRPYIIQVARFDPSKGIPDVLAAYKELRRLLERRRVEKKDIPQLVITGNSAIDDPEASIVYGQVIDILNGHDYDSIRCDIKVIRLPHNDQLLGTILAGASLAWQLSHREGFEIKVTEALMKGVPVIAYQAGGIPLQIENKKSGFLVPVGEIKKVASLSLELLSKPKEYQKMSSYARSHINPDYLTVNSACHWLQLALMLSSR